MIDELIYTAFFLLKKADKKENFKSALSYFEFITVFLSFKLQLLTFHHDV